MNSALNHLRTPWAKWGSLSILIVFAALALTPPMSAAAAQRQRITSDPRGVGAQFGNAVALSGNTMVVGARFDSTTASQAGAAFVYVLSGTTWTQQARLLASDGAAIDKFGYSVAISGDTIVVGAYSDDSPQSNAGSAYVFVRSGTTWTQQQKLATGGPADQEFGNAVAIVGDTIAVGEHFADLPSNAEAGAVYIYQRTGTVWAQTQKLIPVGGVILGDHFGESLAVSGGTLVVGADGTDIPETAAGSVYVFTGSGGTYVQQQKLSIPDGGNGDNFGFSVAIEGTTLIGGALFYTPIVGQISHGAAYVFEFNGATWSQQGRLVPSDGATADNFGWSVAVSGETVAVGARGDDTTAGADAGSAYLFTRSGTTWTQQEKLAPADPINGDRFGASVALSSGNLVVGASEKALTSPNGQGAVYYFKSQVRHVFPDFDGDRKADFSFFRPSDGTWNVTKSSDSSTLSSPFGIASDLIAPADYDGDGKTDIAVFRPTSGNWYVLRSTAGTLILQFGLPGDLPMPGDYDGDGLADVCVFRPSTGEWFRINSSTTQVILAVFGTAGDIPLIGDFDGDGLSDLSYYRPSNGSWVVLRSSDGTTYSTTFGVSTDIPVPTDYDGDGKTDIAVYRPDGGTWHISESSGSTQILQFGVAGDKPVPADYDGDGKADIAIFRPATGTWYVLRSTDFSFFAAVFGATDSIPVPLFFIRQAMSAPIITTQPVNQTVISGVATSFTIAATGSTTLTYQWQRLASGSATWTNLSNGGAYSNVTTATLAVTTALAQSGDQFRVVVTGTTGFGTVSSVVSLTVTPSTARLLNLSTRAQCLTGDNLLIPGFVLSGTGTKRVLIRGVGPTLGSFGVNDTLADPQMNLVNSAGAAIATNNDWGTNANKAVIIATAATVGAFPLVDGSKDAVLLLDLPPGAYTVPTSGVATGIGVAIVELYDADTATPTATLVNISNRGFVGVGDNVMIPGIVVSNEGPRTFLLRAVGPTLGGFGVAGTLADPVLTVFRGSAAILTNDDWGNGTADTASVAATVGAFPLSPGSKDAAFVVTLQPGAYTVQATGAGGTTGVALVEVYLVP